MDWHGVGAVPPPVEQVEQEIVSPSAFKHFVSFVFCEAMLEVLKMSEKHLKSGKMYGLKQTPWATL